MGKAEQLNYDFTWMIIPEALLAMAVMWVIIKLLNKYKPLDKLKFWKK